MASVSKTLARAGEHGIANGLVPTGALTAAQDEQPAGWKGKIVLDRVGAVRLVDSEQSS